MSVTSVELLWTQRGGRDGIDRQQSFTRLYEVLTDDPLDDENIAGGVDARALGLPGNGDALADWTDAAVTDIHGENSPDSPTIWYFTVTYETRLPDEYTAETQGFDPTTGESFPTDIAPQGGVGGPGGQGGHHRPPKTPRDSNPLNWDLQWSFSHEQTREPVRFANDGTPLTNSALFEFSPAVEIERSYPIITIVKTYEKFKIEWLELFQDSVNNAEWYGRPARTCRMVAIDAAPDTTNNTPFWRVTFRIKVKPGSWDDRTFSNGILVEPGRDLTGLPGAADRPLDIGQGWDLRLADVGYDTTTFTATGIPATPYSMQTAAITPPSDNRGGEKPGPYPLDGYGQLLPQARSGSNLKLKFVTYRVYKEKNWGLLQL